MMYLLPIQRIPDIIHSMDKINLFKITMESLNLFSFMLGMTFAVIQSWYERIAINYVIIYFAALAGYYYMLYHNVTH